MTFSSADSVRWWRVQARCPPLPVLLHQFGAGRSHLLEGAEEAPYSSVTAALADGQRVLELAASLSRQLPPDEGATALRPALQPLTAALHLTLSKMQPEGRAAAGGAAPDVSSELLQVEAASARVHAVLAMRARGSASPASPAAAMWLRRNEAVGEAMHPSGDAAGGSPSVAAHVVEVRARVRLLQQRQGAAPALAPGALQHQAQAAASDARQVLGSTAADLARLQLRRLGESDMKSQDSSELWCILFTAAFLSGEDPSTAPQSISVLRLPMRRAVLDPASDVDHAVPCGGRRCATGSALAGMSPAKRRRGPAGDVPIHSRPAG